MKIIDFAKKGNVVRFYLGKDDLKKWWGDDWNDRPYEYNAGQVYDRFVSGIKDVAFPFGDLVIEPSEGTTYSEYCKEDMMHRKVPCIIVVPEKLAKDDWYGNDFMHWAGTDGVTKYYFGDRMVPDKAIVWKEDEHDE